MKRRVLAVVAVAIYLGATASNVLIEYANTSAQFFLAKFAAAVDL